LLQRHFHFFTARLLQELSVGGVGGQVDGEAPQCLLDGIMAVVADRRDVAAAQVLQHEALEQVVDVINRKRQINAGVPLDFTFSLVVANATAEEDDLRDR
jgi:hypothetical protein